MTKGIRERSQDTGLKMVTERMPGQVKFSCVGLVVKGHSKVRDAPHSVGNC